MDLNDPVVTSKLAQAAVAFATQVQIVSDKMNQTAAAMSATGSTLSGLTELTDKLDRKAVSLNDKFKELLGSSHRIDIEFLKTTATFGGLMSIGHEMTKTYQQLGSVINKFAQDSSEMNNVLSQERKALTSFNQALQVSNVSAFAQALEYALAIPSMAKDTIKNLFAGQTAQGVLKPEELTAGIEALSTMRGETAQLAIDGAKARQMLVENRQALTQFVSESEIDSWLDSLTKSEQQLSKAALSKSLEDFTVELPETQKAVKDQTRVFARLRETVAKSGQLKKAFDRIDIAQERLAKRNISVATASDMIGKSINNLLPGTKGVSEALLSPLKNMGYLMNLPDALQQFVKSTRGLVTSLGAVGVFFGALMVVFDMLKRGLAITSDSVQKLGTASTMLKNPLQDVGAMMENMTVSAPNAALFRKDWSEMFSLVGQATNAGLYGITTLDKGIVSASGQMLAMADVIDLYAKGIGQDFGTMAEKMLVTARATGVKLTNITATTGYDLIHRYQALNDYAFRHLAMSFDEIQKLAPRAIERMGYLAGRRSTEATNQILQVFGRIRDEFVRMGAAGDMTTQQLKGIFNTISQSVERSSWDMYYGVQAVQGKLTDNFKKDLSAAFATTPMERWGAQLQFMRTAALEWADLGDVWLAFTGMFDGLPEELTQKIGNALKPLDTAAIKEMGKTPKEFIENLTKSSNLSPEEIVQLQRATSALENPLQTLVQTVFQIYDLLSQKLSGFLLKSVIGH